MKPHVRRWDNLGRWDKECGVGSHVTALSRSRRRLERRAFAHLQRKRFVNASICMTPPQVTLAERRCAPTLAHGCEGSVFDRGKRYHVADCPWLEFAHTVATQRYVLKPVRGAPSSQRDARGGADLFQWGPWPRLAKRWKPHLFQQNAARAFRIYLARPRCEASGENYAGKHSGWPAHSCTSAWA